MNCVGGTTDAAIRPTTPTNLAVLAGTTVTFGCEITESMPNTTSRIRWAFNEANRDLPHVLYNGNSVHHRAALRVSVNSTDHGNEITIKNVGVGDSGSYSCHKFEKYSIKVDFRLLVRLEGTSSIIN